MTAVLDTTVLIDLLRGNDRALRYLEALQSVPVCSEVTRLELLTGLRSAERRAADALCATLDWVAVDEPIARRAGELGRRFRSSHPGIDAADLAIAATAQQLEAALVTANVKHFPMFSRLRAPY